MLKRISRRLSFDRPCSTQIDAKVEVNDQIQAKANDVRDESINDKTVLDGLSKSKVLYIIGEQLCKGDITKLNPNVFLNEQINIIPYNPNREIRMKNFRVGKILGKGNFGAVYEGEVFGLLYPGSRTKVAIKTIDGEATLTHINCFLTEIKIMSNLDFHCNLVNMVGCHTFNLKENNGAWLILEYCNEKDLLRFVVQNRRKFNESFKTSSKDANQLIHSRLMLTMALDIAKGMEYLSSKLIMHGDLAARNVLLTYNYNCPNKLLAKVSDFGLSKHMANKKYYRKRDRNYVPWKWMAFEFLEDGIFKMKSDVWSYGVTIWEMFSLGMEPYGVEEYQDVFDKLQRRKYLMCPVEINAIQLWPATEMYNRLSKMCFVNEEDNRASFSDIVRYLTLQLNNEEVQEYRNLTKVYSNRSSHIYLNIKNP